MYALIFSGTCLAVAVQPYMGWIQIKKKGLKPWPCPLQGMTLSRLTLVQGSLNGSLEREYLHKARFLTAKPTKLYKRVNKRGLQINLPV